MKAKIFFAAFLCVAFISSCGQDYNSNSGDAAFGDQSNNCNTAATPLLCSALPILRTNCASCHSDFNSYLTDADWVASGKVNPGDADGSMLITYLQNSGGSTGTMPKEGNPISNSDYLALKNWIDGMNK